MMMTIMMKMTMMRITMLLVTRLLLMMILTMMLVTDEIDSVRIMTKMSENDNVLHFMVISFSF